MSRLNHSNTINQRLKLVELSETYSLKYTYDMKDMDASTITMSFSGFEIYRTVNALPDPIKNKLSHDRFICNTESLVEVYGRLKLGIKPTFFHSSKHIDIAKSALNGCPKQRYIIQSKVMILIVLKIEDMYQMFEDFKIETIKNGTNPDEFIFERDIWFMDEYQNQKVQKKFEGKTVSSNEKKQLLSK